MEEQREALDDSYAATFDMHRPRLFALAYQMLGAVADAEDIVQEAFLRWQRICQPKPSTPDAEVDENTVGEPEEGAASIRHPRAYLSTVVTRLCLAQLRSARARREQYVGPWLPEPLPDDPAYCPSIPDPSAMVEMAEELSTAFLLILERMTPVERVVFLLREAFDCDYEEIAETVGQSSTYCRQLLRRAKLHVKTEKPRYQASPAQQQEVFSRFIEACSTLDYDDLVSVMAPDAVMTNDGGGKVKSATRPVYGPDRIARFLIGVSRLVPQNIHFAISTMNGQPALICTHEGKPYTVIVLDITEQGIQHLYIHRNPDKMRHLRV